LSLSLQLNTKGKKIEEVNGSEEESMALVETRGNKWKQLDAAARFASDQVCSLRCSGLPCTSIHGDKDNLEEPHWTHWHHEHS
jgi:hypothetical protein